VAYGSDPRRVQELLLTIARDHPEVLTTPEPSVTLDEFAASNLRFTLYAFIGDIGRGGAIRTDLATAIIETFGKAGIAIPSGQSEIAIRRMDWLREVIGESASLSVGKRPTNGSKTAEEPAAASVSTPAK
jgi:potassium-dependent mechanosensitive channel